jgi:hypothetical protein
VGTAQIRRRLERIDRAMQPPADNGFTLERLCRHVWRRDKSQFRKLALNSISVISSSNLSMRTRTGEGWTVFEADNGAGRD